MSMTVDESSPRDMVKAPLTRKARQYQTAVERWSTLKQNSDRSFDRLNFRNRFEEDRLQRKRRVISEISDAQLKEIFRVKDEMRVALIDIAKSKRQYNSNESDFESRLRSGKQSPMFKMEYRRLRRKQVELEKLGEQLKGPNAKLLASNLTSELKSVELKAQKELTRRESKYKGKWLAPLKNLQKAAPQNALTDGESMEAIQKTKPPGNDFASLVQMVHSQFKKTSLSENKHLEHKKDEAVVAKDDENVESTSKLRLPDLKVHSQETHKEVRDNFQRDKVEAEREQTEGVLYPISKLPKSFIPIDVECYAVEDISAPSVDPEVEVKRKKLQHKCSKDLRLPTLTEVSETPAERAPDAVPSKTKRSKKQKARALLKKNVQPIVSNAPVSRTESARRRDRHVRKRLSDLASKTKEDIANRRSVSPSDEALNSIHQAEVVTRLQLARSKVGITLPEVRREKKWKGQETRTKTLPREEAVSLPPLNLEGNLLRELKAQRRKHKSHTTRLPKLP